MAKEPMPDWLKRSLIDKGVMTAEGLTRKAKIMRCVVGCGMPTMAGFDEDNGYMDAWCDLPEISAYGEVQALIARRRTYSLRGTDGYDHRLLLYRRGRYSIKYCPAGPSNPDPVLVNHVCGEPVPWLWKLLTRAPREEKAQKVHPLLYGMKPGDPLEFPF